MLRRAGKPWTRTTWELLLGAWLLAGNTACRAQQLAPAFRAVLARDHAAGVLVDLATHRTLASIGPGWRALPGSVLKPVFLEYALEHHLVRATTEVYCRRDLRIAGRSLPCTHPVSVTGFPAETALAYSCNTWFARLADRYNPEQMRAALAEVGLATPVWQVGNKADRELTMLGLLGPRWTPLQVAGAYEVLLRQLPVGGAVEEGLLGSVRYGMAHPAATSGVTLLGKTGTASDPGEAWTHGWFAGAVRGQWLMVILVPHGDGGTAAGLAREILQRAATASGASTGASR